MAAIREYISMSSPGATEDRRFVLKVNGEYRRGYHIDIVRFPQGDRPGVAEYVDARGTNDSIKFLYNPETEVLDAWLSPSEIKPENTFVIRMVTQEDRVYGLDVQFPNMQGFVAHFELEDHDDYFEEPTEEIFLASMEMVDF